MNNAQTIVILLMYKYLMYSFAKGDNWKRRKKKFIIT